MAMKVLMLVDWQVARLEVDSDAIQAPDKLVRNLPYWFFRHWPGTGIDVDLLDIGNRALLSALEGKVLHFYVTQSLIAYLKRKKYDLILSHGARSALVLAFLRSLTGERMPPHVVIDVGCFNGGRSDPFELFLVKKAGRAINGIICHSSVQSAYYDRYLPGIPHRFVPFGADADHFRPAGLFPEDYVLSFGSRMRDYPTLVEAWGKVERGETRLKIVGTDTLALGRAPGGGVDLLGRLPLQALRTCIAKARFIVMPLPFQRYSYGQMSFLQSMAMGKSCIVTKTPSSEDYLTDSKDALLVNPYDPADLADKITLLLSDPRLNAEIARHARRTIEERFNEKIMAREIHDFIATVV